MKLSRYFYYLVGIIPLPVGLQMAGLDNFLKASLARKSPAISDQNYRFYTKSSKTMLKVLKEKNEIH